MRIEIYKMYGFKNVKMGYLFDTVEEKVYSNLQQKNKTNYGALMGSKSTRGRFWKLQTRYPEYPQTVLLSTLRERAKDYQRHVLQQVEEFIEKDKQDMSISSPSTKGWIIGTVENGSIKLSSSPKIHETSESAKNEVNRLAQMNAGTKFVVLRIENYVQAASTVWS